MKPYEIFETFRVFKSVMEGTDVPQEMKLKVALEFKASLSPSAFSSSCPVTRQWLENTVHSKITELQNERDKPEERTSDRGVTEGIPQVQTEEETQDKKVSRKHKAKA